jgi:hypothetical protein
MIKVIGTIIIGFMKMNVLGMIKYNMRFPKANTANAIAHGIPVIITQAPVTPIIEPERKIKSKLFRICIVTGKYEEMKPNTAKKIIIPNKISVSVFIFSTPCLIPIPVLSCLLLC